MMGYFLKNKSALLLVLCLGVLIAPLLSSAQTYAEFVRQKKTQKKYLLQQIAALEVYLGYAKKGYEIAGTGWRTVKDLAGGELSLHSAFFSSLSSVSPAVKNYARLPEIVSAQLEVLDCFRQLLDRMREVDSSSSPVSYVEAVRAEVLLDCAKDLETLLLLITPDRLQMGDEGRLSRMEEIYISMQDKLVFTRSFSAQVSILLAHKDLSVKSMQFLNKAYGNLE